MAKMKREKKSFESKVRDLDEHFVEDVLVMTPAQLNDKLIGLTKYRIELEEEKENDMDLKAAQEAAAEAGAVYRENFKAIKMKQKYIFNLLGNQGVVSTGANEKSLAKAVRELKNSLGDDGEISVSINNGPEVKL